MTLEERNKEAFGSEVFECPPEFKEQMKKTNTVDLLRLAKELATYPEDKNFRQAVINELESRTNYARSRV